MLYNLFSVIQKINKKYWFYIKNITTSLDLIKKNNKKKKLRIYFLNKLMKRKKPIFTHKLRYMIKKQNLSYKYLIQPKSKYNLFFNKKQ